MSAEPKIILSKFVDIFFKTPDNQSFKFGYYNYSPMSYDGKKLLAHRIYFEKREPLPNDVVDIGYFDLTDNKWIKVSESNAFNWQLGSMLQWLGPSFNNEIIFNDSDGKKYISRIINLDSLEEKILPRAIYAVDPYGKFSITLNFERSHFTRAYSYVSFIDERWNKKIPESDGIIKINLENGYYHTIIPIKKIVKINKENNNNYYEFSHWIEHIMLNPSGTRFVFYHRFGNKINYFTRCFTANVDGSEIWMHPVASTDRISHLGWRDDNSYVIYTYSQSKIKTAWIEKQKFNKNTKFYISIYRKFIKPIIPRKVVSNISNTKSYYSLTIDKVGVIDKINPLPGNMDGHPSFTKDGRFMLTDTYADKNNYRHLLLFDIKNSVTIELGSFYSPFNKCSWRADLHPRFSPDEKFIIIDSAHNGFHQMIILIINWDYILKYINK